MSTGLFLVRRERMRMTRRICSASKRQYYINLMSNEMMKFAGKGGWHARA